MATSKNQSRKAADPLDFARRMQKIMASLCAAAMDYLAKAKVEETAFRWLARAPEATLEQGDAELAQAFVLAMELALFTPSMSGIRPVDRLARLYKSKDAEEAAALTALKLASFRLLNLHAMTEPGLFHAEDLVSGEMISLFDEGLTEAARGSVAARLCPVAEGNFVPVGPILALDKAALDIGLGFVRHARNGPSRTVLNGQRCAAAIYRYVVRSGGSSLLNLRLESEASPSFEGDELDAIAWLWASLAEDKEPIPESIEAVRHLASVETVSRILVASYTAGQAGMKDHAEAYRKVAFLQMETLQRRASINMGGDPSPLDTLAAALAFAVHEKHYPSEAAKLFAELRRLVSIETAPRDDDLARVIERIQALRAKTVEQGCTEQEALAAARKIAELLERYGLSLSEIDMRRQTCDAVGVETERKRRGALDNCVPPIANFCDCKAWGEKTAAGTIRYVFFGLPADVEAAHSLYDLIACAFETETGTFKTNTLYREMPSGERRNAVNSFQIGLAAGINGKLDHLKTERQAAILKSSGRDLVPLKTSVVDDELAKLGLSFHTQGKRQGRLVLAEAYEAGQIAGSQLEINARIEQD